MAKNKKNYELEIMISGGTDASLASSIQKARKEIDRLERQAMYLRGISGIRLPGLMLLEEYLTRYLEGY